MNLIEISKDKLTLEISKKELMVLINALKEVRKSIEDWEFGIRMGIEVEEADIMLESLKAICDKIAREESQI